MQQVKTWLEARNRLAGVSVTARAGQMPDLTQEAVAKGHRNLLILGGDGTANEVANGIMTQAICPSDEITLGVIGVGTGNDWLRTLGISTKVDQALQVLDKGVIAKHDVGLVSWGADEEHRRYFVNIAGSGFDGEVTLGVANQKGWMAGTKFAYWKHIVRSLFSYKRTQLRLQVGREDLEMETLTLAVGVCRYNGGGMKQCPDADYSDGLLDVTLIGKMSTAEMVMRLPMMLNGSFVKLPQVHRWTGEEVRISSHPEVWLEVDGEVLGQTPGVVRCLKQRLRVLVPADKQAKQ